LELVLNTSSAYVERSRTDFWPARWVHDRCRIRIHLWYNGFHDVRREFAADEGYLFPDILYGHVDVPFEHEFDGDAGGAFGAVEVMDLTPLMVLTASSILSVTVDVHDLGTGPLRVVMMLTMGNSIFGKRSTPMLG
jgi:hypothetical protein